MISDNLLQNPLSLLTKGNESQLKTGEFGAVLARAGVGKTSVMVQLALYSMLNDQKVLHISLDDPVNKVALWYEELIRIIGEKHPEEQTHEMWAHILPKRFIMTFKAEKFSPPTLKERLTDLTSQSIFEPSMIIVDGLAFEATDREVFSGLQSMAREMNLFIWFTVLTHRHEGLGRNGLPVQLDHCDEFFKTIIQLQPQEDKIFINTLRGATDDESKHLLLDPATLIVTAK